MNQPTPGPQQPYQPPAWGHPQHPGPYNPPPKKGMSAGAIVAIVLGSIVGLFVLLAIFGALISEPDTDDKTSESTTPTTEASAPAPAKKPKAPAEPAKDAPVKVAAQKTKFTPGVLHDGGAYTSVTVTITNNSGKTIDINPLYFAITGTDGSKHTAELGMDENQMDTVDLAPGENITGVITGKGDFTPKYVTYTDGLFGDGIRGNVS